MATPHFIKQIMRSTPAQWVLAAGIAGYCKAVQWTGQIDCPEPPLRDPYILALWHGRIIMLPIFRRGSKPMIALISAHRDGRIISRAARFFGILTATGSSTRGGSRAVRELIRWARDGHHLFVTPDGPRGPRMCADGGIIDLARLTKLPIVPATMSARGGRIIDSWDRFLLPALFTRVVVRWGEPIRVGEGEEREPLRQRLETALIAIQQQADRDVGREPVMPADPAV